MQKYLTLFTLLLLLLFSCNNDDAQKNPNDEFFNNLKGHYSLKEMYSEIPVDLNFDNITNADLLSEIDCIIAFPPELYKASVEYYAPSGKKVFTFETANQDIQNEDNIQSKCFYPASLSYSFDRSGPDNQIIITNRNTEREADYGILTNVTLQDDTFDFILKKEYYTSQGWQEVNTHLLYEKDN